MKIAVAIEIAMSLAACAGPARPTIVPSSAGSMETPRPGRDYQSRCGQTGPLNLDTPLSRWCMWPWNTKIAVNKLDEIRIDAGREIIVSGDGLVRIAERKRGRVCGESRTQLPPECVASFFGYAVGMEFGD